MIRKLKNRYSSMPLLAKAAIWLTASQVLLKGIGVLSSPLFTRLISPSEYGKLTLFLSYEQIILILSTWEMGVGPYQKGIFKFKTGIRHFTKTVLLFSAVLTVILFSLLIVLWKPAQEFMGISRTVMAVLFMYMLTLPAHQCWLTRSRVNYTYKSQAFLTVFLSVTQIIVPLIAVLTIERTAEVKILFTLIPAICINVVLYVNELRKRNEIVDEGQLRNEVHFLCQFTPPLVFHSLSFFILSQVDRIMIGKMVGEIEAGIYGVAYMIATLALIIQNSFLQVLRPWVYRKMEKGEYTDIKQFTAQIVVLLGAVYMLIILVVPEIMKILYSQTYHRGIWCIPPIAIGMFFMFFYSLFVIIEEYFEETKYIGMISVACAFLNIVMNYFAIKMFGYEACAYTTLICYIIFAVGHYAVMRVILKKNEVQEGVFNGRALLFVALGMLLVMGTVILLYDFVVARYLILAMFGVVLYLFRKKIGGAAIQLLRGGKDEV